VVYLLLQNIQSTFIIYAYCHKSVIMTKALFFTCLTLLTFSCSTAKEKPAPEEQPKEQDCPNFINVGTVKICLPELDSMAESYNDSIFKKFADDNELASNKVLSLYTRNPTNFYVNAAGQKIYDDFFKIFIVKDLQDMKTDQAYLDQVDQSIIDSHTFETWGVVQKKLEKGFDFVPKDQPYFIDHYSPDQKVKSFVCLYRYNTGTYETLLLGIMNIILIKERLIGLTYYKAFTGQESLPKTRNKNDAIVLKLLAYNTP
jgi:hypothetical protein